MESNFFNPTPASRAPAEYGNADGAHWNKEPHIDDNGTLELVSALNFWRVLDSMLHPLCIPLGSSIVIGVEEAFALYEKGA